MKSIAFSVCPLKAIRNIKLIFFILFFQLSANAATYDVRSCTTKDQLCSTCKKLNLKVIPKINITNSTVILNYKDEANIFSSSVQSNCKVVDLNNWSCIESSKNESLNFPGDGLPTRAIYTPEHGHKMLNGVLVRIPFSQSILTATNGRLVSSNLFEVSYGCYIID